MTPEPPKTGTPLDSRARDTHALLDEALAESFPAGEPISVGRRKAEIDGGAS